MYYDGQFDIFYGGIVQMYYFLFVTFSTVGYGANYYPLSTIECFLGCFLMLFGTLIFARVLAKFDSVWDFLYSDKERNNELTYDLSKWLKALKRHNNNHFPVSLS
jgi:hypothetical protein